MERVVTERRLVAIMLSDIVGYTALMSVDQGTGVRARERHTALVGDLSARYHGECLEEVGDETLSVFPSAADAVNCALAVQRELAEDTELQVRIGIHLEDVVFAGGRVYGDGVNVAARIRPLASPGGICISDEVQHSVHNQPNIRTTRRGPQNLKNVGRPVVVFDVGGARRTAAPSRGHPTATAVGTASRCLRVPGADRRGLVAAQSWVCLEANPRCHPSWRGSPSGPLLRYCRSKT